jgi:hypothetical protein
MVIQHQEEIDELIENDSQIDKADEEIDITNGNVPIIKLNNTIFNISRTSIPSITTYTSRG